MSKLSRLEKYLKSGSAATPRQITGMFGLQNPSAAIHELRSQGVCVYCNTSTLSNGSRTVKYTIGRPTRKMIAMAHALGMFA